MQYTWLFVLPLLFLPNLGFENATAFGTLQVSDYFIGPYLILVILGAQPMQSRWLERSKKRYIDFLIVSFLIFLWWTVTSTLTIPLRYDYPNFNPMYFSLLKIGKLSLYVVAAVFTMRALANLDQSKRIQFLWSLLASGVLVGVTLLITGNSLEGLLPSSAQGNAGQVFQENPTSVMMSIFIAFLVGMLVRGNGTATWRLCASAGLVLMILGFLFAKGRGGWLAAIASMIYIASRINLKQTVRLTILGALLIAFAYNQFPDFREEVDRTLRPDTEYLETYDAGIFGIDDGARLVTLENEVPKFLDAPLFGTGFSHRGGLSGLWSTGSHNFFVQMFLETGFLGGVVIIVIFRQMWRHASSRIASDSGLELPVKAALVAAIVSGLSGEYFYGGMVLFTLLLAYASVGAQHATNEELAPQPMNLKLRQAVD